MSFLRRYVRVPRLRTVAIAVAVLAAVGTLGYQWLERHHLKRFQEVKPGVFYRVAQPTEWGVRHLIERYGVRTIVNLQLYDMRLQQGLLGLVESDGAKESEWVTRCGARQVQWPMGEEACWPWPTPWQFEQFFQLMDDPQNLPVAIHCMGGRHRTGTIAALFRLEYDRWPVDKTLAEMHSFKFPERVPLQEYNLRTYVPRPHPDRQQWQALVDDFAQVLPAPAPTHYEQLVRRLRAQRTSVTSTAAVTQYLAADKPFALPLILRLVDGVDHPLTRPAVAAARRTLQRDDATAADLMAAAALVADFGAPDEQRALIDRLATDVRAGQAVTPAYAALVAGIANRYTPNRVAFLAPLLDDQRACADPDAGGIRYCDLALVRLAAMTDQPFFVGTTIDRQAWDQACMAAQHWLSDHPQSLRLSTLIPPEGHKLVKAGDGPVEEDLSRLK
jgi:hypothetical protein